MEDYMEMADKASPPILPALNRLKHQAAIEELRLVVYHAKQAGEYAKEYRRAIFQGRRQHKRPFMFWTMWKRENEDEIKRAREEQTAQLLLAALGMIEESTDILDGVYNHIQTGRPLDQVTLRERSESLMWYLAKAAKWLRTSFPMMMAMNIGKLKYLYPEKYREEAKKQEDGA